ncbi:ABC transporter ATP-binding protein [Sulfobacillus thermosulfidooxidans]|uniref:ABC transporter ATP-binding protein n=1 Tax=Sulfobacillus thermosulfidooxidans TaxID=28034 RepID=UPI0006B50DCD|nr:ABC transporter ATP-binding protein [Sulfobacillus thermosulfidooxidans]
MVQIEVNDVSVKYGSYQALQHVSLKIPRGEYWILLGENGAGKSTLLRCLAMWMRPTQGSIVIEGSNAEHNERVLRSRIKFVPDTPVFYAELTAWEHAQLIATLHHLNNWESKAHELFRIFFLDQHQNTYPVSYSRGMQYKLAVLLTLIVKPALLLLDEPFGPLDPTSQSHLATILKQLCQEEHMTVVASTHLLPEVIEPDHLVFLNQGRILLDESWEPVKNQYPGSVASLPYRLSQSLFKNPPQMEIVRE